jgi:hypothetical protein
MATDRWTKLADLAADLYTKTLTVAPSTRPYISQQDCLYDYHVGHDFTVVDTMSPIHGCRITVCDRHTLKEHYSITHLSIRFNPGMAPVEVAL